LSGIIVVMAENYHCVLMNDCLEH